MLKDVTWTTNHTSDVTMDNKLVSRLHLDM